MFFFLYIHSLPDKLRISPKIVCCDMILNLGGPNGGPSLLTGGHWPPLAPELPLGLIQPINVLMYVSDPLEQRMRSSSNNTVFTNSNTGHKECRSIPDAKDRETQGLSTRTKQGVN